MPALLILLFISLALFLTITLRKAKSDKIKFKQALSEASHSAIQLENTLNSLTEGVAVIDENYNIVNLNKSYQSFFNLEKDELLMKKCYKVLNNLDKPCPQCPIANSHYHDGFLFTLSKIKVKVDVKTFQLSSKQHYIETLQNVSQFEELNVKLRRSERLASIGIMVAGIAHEINNPLSSISGNSQLMIRMPEKYGLNEKGIERVKTMFTSVERATAIVNDLLYLSKPSQFKFKKLQLKNIINDSISKFKEKEVNGIHFDLSNLSPEVYIWGHSQQLENVIHKVIRNSMHALIDNCLNKPNFKGFITFNTLIRPQSITLHITDNGGGVSKENLSHVFDPFYTTKEPGVGTGLSLSICHRIMLEHAGSINLKNSEEGVEIELIFPSERPIN